MSFFNKPVFGGSSFSGQGAATSSSAADIARLLNSYSNTWIQLEKETQATKAKQAQAQEAYHTAVQDVHAAKQRVLRGEEQLASMQADCTQAQHDIDAKQEMIAKVQAEVDALRAEVDALQHQDNEASAKLLEGSYALLAELRALKQANPQSFFAA